MDERLDGFLLVVTALLLCGTGIGAFFLAEIYHVSPLWVFFAFTSGGMVVIFIKDFSGQLKRPAFVAYLVAWACAHGLLIIALTHWRVPFTLMLVSVAIELTLGLVLADYLFEIRPTPG